MAKRRLSGLKAFSVIRAPRTNAPYLAIGAQFDYETGYVRHYDFLPIIDLGPAHLRVANESNHVQVFVEDFKRQMGLPTNRLYAIDGNAVPFEQLFDTDLSPKGDKLNPAYDILVDYIGSIDGNTKITKPVQHLYFRLNGRTVSEYKDLHDLTLLQRGRAPAHLAIDNNVLPREAPTPADDETSPLMTPDPVSVDEAKPQKPAITIKLAKPIPPKSGVHTHQLPPSDSSTSERSEERKIVDLSDLASLFDDRALPSAPSDKINPSEITLAEAVERVEYGLSDLALDAISGEEKNNFDAPVWRLKDTAPKSSPMKDQTLILSNVFALFSNDSVTPETLQKSLHHVGKVTATEIYDMIQDPSFRSHFDIK